PLGVGAGLGDDGERHHSTCRLAQPPPGDPDHVGGLPTPFPERGEPRLEACHQFGADSLSPFRPLQSAHEILDGPISASADGGDGGVDDLAWIDVQTSVHLMRCVRASGLAASSQLGVPITSTRAVAVAIPTVSIPRYAAVPLPHVTVIPAATDIFSL